ncbi:MAG TPA: hypothetical protein VFJ47_12030 [Terriglobales bacterium]|nr:hypothetical protein [Terriglobales bacterium]
MMRRLGVLVGALAILVVLAAAYKRDPLTTAEIDQLRDTAMEPDTRLKLYVKFARARLTTLEEKRNDPKVSDRGQVTHDGLEDFLAVYDELNDNIDMYVDRKDDIRKPLKAVIEADTEFQAKLRGLDNAAGTTPQEKKEYQFVLSNAIETLDSSADDHRKLMGEQEEAAKHKKKAAKGQ